MTPDGIAISRRALVIEALGCVAQLVEQRPPKPKVGGSNPSALVDNKDWFQP